MFITNGHCADWIIVAARTNAEAGYGGISNFLVQKGTPGLSASEPLEKMGVRGSPTAGLYFEDCEIPRECLLGEEGLGFVQAMKTLENGRIGMAAYGVGIAQAALDEALKYAKQREAFGRAIIKFQAVHFKLADMKTEIDGARMLMYRAAWLHGRGECPQALFSAAKLFGTEAAVRCTDRAVQIHGGYGYMAEYRVERLYRDARLGPIGEGTSEIQRRLIAQETLALFA
jgi:alkylation response protein AidB-like acyl-CoA dehydrogenase